MKIENLKLKIQSGLGCRQAGFTLIELLIVIALLGALAVGLLATVDPFEQLKKGTDTSARNTTAEIYNAAIRFYAIRNTFPWTAAGIPGDQNAVPLSAAAMTSSGGYLDQIISAGELKPEFIQLAGGNLNTIFLTSVETNDVRQNVAVCFQPQSKSFKNETNAKYNADGSTGANCIGVNPGSANATGCFWCIK